MRMIDSTLAGWLLDAYSMERSAEALFREYADDSSNFPGISEKFREYLDRTHAHISRITDFMEGAGKSIDRSREFRFSLEIPSGSLSDRILNDFVEGFSIANAKNAQYARIAAAAEVLEDQDVLEISSAFREDEAGMAQWIMTNLPPLVREALAGRLSGGEKGKEGATA